MRMGIELARRAGWQAGRCRRVFGPRFWSTSNCGSQQANYAMKPWQQTPRGGRAVWGRYRGTCAARDSDVPDRSRSSPRRWPIQNSRRHLEEQEEQERRAGSKMPTASMHCVHVKGCVLVLCIHPVRRQVPRDVIYQRFGFRGPNPDARATTEGTGGHRRRGRGTLEGVYCDMI